MATYELQPDEVILYEGNVTCKTYKGSLQLTLTSQKVVFEKEKGLFKKERELVDVIPLESVKLYNDAAQIKQRGADVEVQTVGKNITIVFSGMLEARKFTAKIVNAVTGTTLATRGSNMIKDAFALVDDTLGLDTRGVAEDRKVGLGHGNLGAMLLSDESKCFAFLAGHESFAAAEGAIGIVKNANKARKQPLRVILNGLGKDAAQIISRINGFTYVQTQFDYYTGKLNIVREIRYSETERADVRCYGADDVREGVAIMHHEGVDVSITGNSTNPTRFQHPVAGTYKKECIEQGKKYFSVASGGGTGRTLHPDNMAAGPASYGMTDTMGRMHSDAQFAGSSSVPAHVEMMGFLGMGNNPMVGATVAVAVAVAEAIKA